MPSPTWLQIGLTAVKDLSNGEGWNCALRLRLNEQLSAGGPSTSSFLRMPLTACSSAGVSGKTCPLARQSELWLSYKILWLQFLSQMWVSPVSLQRYMFPQTCSFSHFQSHLCTGTGPSRPRIVDRKITLAGPVATDLPHTSIVTANRQVLNVNLWDNMLAGLLPLTFRRSQYNIYKRGNLQIINLYVAVPIVPSTNLWQKLKKYQTNRYKLFRSINMNNFSYASNQFNSLYRNKEAALKPFLYTMIPIFIFPPFSSLEDQL